MGFFLLRLRHLTVFASLESSFFEADFAITVETLTHDVGYSCTVVSCSVRDVRSNGVCALGHENNAEYQWRKSKGPGGHGRQDPCSSR